MRAVITKLKMRKVCQKEKLYSSSVHFQSFVKVNARALKAKVPPLTGEALYRGQNRCYTLYGWFALLSSAAPARTTRYDINVILAPLAHDRAGLRCLILAVPSNYNRDH